MNTLKADPLIDAFKRAAVAAEDAQRDTSDGGTCNFDTPAFRIKGAREARIREAAKAAGVEVSMFTWFGGKWWWLNLAWHGQGNKRTRAMEAALAVLRDLESSGTVPSFEARGYYQMD